MKTTLILIATTLMVCSLSPQLKARRPTTAPPRIQLAILLDTSSSMNGLIDQARREIWGIVNEMSQLSRDKQEPMFEVALYEYGHSRLEAATGFIREILPLTHDLDRVSEELFRLTTSGGSEHCGQVVAEAVRSLEWSAGREDLKVIVIAGNEPFTQGPVDYREAMAQALARGIVVNTIHCGDHETGVRGMWKDAALLADGRYLAINQNLREPQIDAPQDQELAQLNQALNRTYLAYGAQGRVAAARQEQQDQLNAAASPSAFADRAVSKVGRVYRNDAWDLVDAVTGGVITAEDLVAMESKDLPSNMQKLKPAARMAHVEKTAAEREALQVKIRELAAAREAFIAETRAATAKEAGGGRTLRDAILEAVRHQAAAKNFMPRPAAVEAEAPRDGASAGE